MSKMGIGAMNQLADALERAGFTPDDVTRLKQFKQLSQIRDVLSGNALIRIKAEKVISDIAEKIILDISKTEPFIPEGWKIKEHHDCSNPIKISLYLSNEQIKRKDITGNVLLEELRRKSANANVLDYLLIHQEAIPENWKSKYIFFFGTVYLNSVGGECVRYLFWDGSYWDWYYRWLSEEFSFDNPAVIET